MVNEWKEWVQLQPEFRENVPLEIKFYVVWHKKTPV